MLILRVIKKQNSRIYIILELPMNTQIYPFLANVHVRYIVARPSVCLSVSVCRQSVTFVRPTQAIEIFGNVSMPFGTLAIQ